jgi:poly-gamma-glutamate synthesis protein (capsule biosynthesis protein)
MHLPFTASSTMLRILFNGGDNMLGRAIQLTLPTQSPNESLLRDSCSSQHYLEMGLHPAGRATKTLEEIRHANARGEYLWGDYLHLKINPPPNLRLMNLETALTRSIDNKDIPWDKGINYHCHLDNIEGVIEGYRNVLHGSSVASPVCVTLANNHIMDFGRQAFVQETLPFLSAYTERNLGSTQFAGVGGTMHEASRPANWTLSVPSQNKNTGEVNVYVVAVGSMDSGVPSQWKATDDSAGVFWVSRLDSMEAVNDAVKCLSHWLTVHEIAPNNRRTTNSLLILSIHWGPNWAYRYHGDNQKYRQEFAHQCIDECGVDVIYGHSSHHIRGFEAYNGKLIMYGAGDLINDYEGFANSGDEKYCEHGALILADISLETKTLHQLQLIPTVMDQLQLKLLCPSWQSYLDIWNPRTKTYERRSHHENASRLCNAVNDLTKLDAGRSHGIQLRLLKDPDCCSSNYALVYP